MTDQEDNFNLRKVFFDDNTRERNLWSCLGRTCPRLWLSFCPNFCYLVDYLLLLLENIPFQKMWRNYWSIEISDLCSRIHFTLTKSMNRSIFLKNRVFSSLVGSFETGKLQIIYNWIKLGTFQPKVGSFFVNTANHFMMLCKKKLKNSSLFKL